MRPPGVLTLCMDPSQRTTRLSLTDVATVAICLVVALSFVTVILPALPWAREGARRAVEQGYMNQIGIALYARAYDHNVSVLPIPAMLDRDNSTVPQSGSAKNTTANMFSIVLFEHYFPGPEIMVTPRERNTNVLVDFDFTNRAPSAAVEPYRAAWDPAFNADFTRSDEPGNVSYAHRQLIGEHLSRLAPHDTIVATRGPDPSDPDSLWIEEGKWVGSSVLRADLGVAWLEEPERLDPALGIWIEAGDKPADFRRIWD